MIPADQAPVEPAARQRITNEHDIRTLDDQITPSVRPAARAARRSPARAAAQAPAQRAVNGQRITPNFKDADIGQITEAVAQATGKNFILDPRVRAQVTMLS